MALPLISNNMYFDTVLKAVEFLLDAESANQIALGGTGWRTTRERFDPWVVSDDEILKPGLVNVVWTSSSFDQQKSSAYEQFSNSDFTLDCYAADVAIASGSSIIPKDQRAADVLHTLITKVYYAVMSPINFDIGLTPGKIVKPIITSMSKFIPTKESTPINGVIAARLSCRIGFVETPPESTGVDLETINAKTDKDDTTTYTEQEIQL